VAHGIKVFFLNRIYKGICFLEIF